MATLVLSAAGMAAGGSLGGSVLGLSTAVIGRAVGATIGRQIDQRILGNGSEPVAVGQVDRFRLMGASEGAAIPRLHGRMRLAGHVIWATAFQEDSTVTGGGGKGAPRTPDPEVTTYSYTVSMALALCEGQIARVGRVWADGVEVSPVDLNMRVYRGSKTQQPDPKIAVVEGATNTPAYRGIAYVVFEDLPLGQFGNRVPQFTFEVMRPAEPGTPEALADLSQQVRAVAMIPGTGEYALGTRQVELSAGFGDSRAINVNSPSGGTDFSTSALALEEELPKCRSVSLVVSWFGTDLRCGHCDVRPMVEQYQSEGDDPWIVCDTNRYFAQRVPRIDGRPVYGGTPSDASVIQAIRDLSARGMEPMFYPFILMTQLAGNDLPNPWTGVTGQPRLPWRGRITLSRAPGQTQSPDRSAAAAGEVADFMGTAQADDFVRDGEFVRYTGPAGWGYRRFILHYAHLCRIAGGVKAFCIGSEMRGLTQIRGASDSFPAVAALRQLAADVRGILGPDCKISYAADWSEYHGYQPAGTADKYFHLDPLWASDDIDFIGIDNYMPLSDWRDGEDHSDASAGSIYDLDYLRANVAGGEGFDWYYPTPEARAAQRRVPITDGDGEPWVWRYKDLSGWWQNRHHDRIGGVRSAVPTPWVPGSKPIWFTEFGCAAIDKGTNQPNKFLDPKSSESLLPRYSSGARDDFMQMQYLRAIWGHYAVPQNNPLSETGPYRGRMLDMDRAHVWCWDARPFPHFPANAALWSDGDNYARGHWLNGRATARTLAGVVAEICAEAGLTRVDVSCLYGVVRGYVIDRVGTARAALQPLLLAYGVEVAERDGVLVFRNRDGVAVGRITQDDLVLDDERGADILHIRAPEAEVTGRVQVGYVESEADYAVSVAQAIHAAEQTTTTARTEFPLVLTRTEGLRVAHRWINEARTGRDTVAFSVPQSRGALGAGDVVELDDAGLAGRYRIDRIEEMGMRRIEATRLHPEAFQPQRRSEEGARLRSYKAPGKVVGLFLDLPLIRGDEVPHEPHFATTSQNWGSAVALYSAPSDNGYVLQDVFRRRGVIGELTSPLARGRTALWDRQTLTVNLVHGALYAIDPEDVLFGRNVLAIGDGSADDWEIVQFAQAQLIGDRTFALTELLRGQAGSSAMIRDTWPAGSKVVLMDGRPEQVTIPTYARGQRRHFRFGPVKRPYTDRSYRHVVEVFKGNGYRPYPVVHLKADFVPAGLNVAWIRQTRIDGDHWGRGDVPLGEERERYVVQVRQGDLILREDTVSASAWTYPRDDGLAEVGNAAFVVAVAQLSERYGTGPFVSINVGG
ncbi:glycoside hydrolase/phage tail family protein [Loktanella sp. TSTF-M6]|uniref:Glycoside hydrolase/phage tail family protein n=1 Tax=Loktanella gaetbuli TaxID=2881335 RepID=A0ABS8BQG9_9RHOB|nr:glycoside hydrolase/phage tail family protein [Loktanella gaetbuli]MCB5197849.1 glycoside hydrolase/phage tail family protein [Loktanella gaetbuli]